MKTILIIMKTMSQTFANTSKKSKIPLKLEYKSNTKSKSNSKYKSKTKSKTRKSPGKVIHRFMKQTKAQRQSHFLQNICSDSGLCIAFGTENNKIKEFFNNFAAFDYVVPPINSIGVPSANGFIKEINYQHKNYTANTILKSSISYEADNLFYEYFVGLTVNKWTNYFPCFVETYGLYKYKNNPDYENIKNTKHISDISLLKNALELISTSKDKLHNFDVNDTCKNSKYYSVLIQHIRNAPTLRNKLNSISSINSLAILAQVYFVLKPLTNDFVHNDLHTGNIMLYQPASDKYICLHYYFPDNSVIVLKSYYVAKIIDYGRCYVSTNKNLYTYLCSRPDCDDCGGAKGFWMQSSLNTDTYYISSIVRNPSHDLRLFKSIFPKAVNYKTDFGTPANTNKNINKPNNVSDASDYLKRYFNQPGKIYFSETEFPPDKKFADLHIYLDMSASMRFTKV